MPTAFMSPRARPCERASGPSGRWLPWVGLWLAAACASDPPVEQQSDSIGSGATLEGQIVLAEGYELPHYKTRDQSRPTLIEVSPPGREACAGAASADAVGLRLGRDRGVEGVVVAAADFVGHRRRKARVHEVVIEHCRMSPHTVVAQLGDRLRVENRDPRPYPLTLGPSVEPGELRPGDSWVVDLQRVGAEPLLCAAPSRCGRTDVFVLYHPVATVTGPDGRFRIDDFPTGEGVVVGAWHPLLGEARTTLWLTPGQHARTSLPVRPYDAPPDDDE
jgi:hypothetical protein